MQEDCSTVLRNNGRKERQEHFSTSAAITQQMQGSVLVFLFCHCSEVLQSSLLACHPCLVSVLFTGPSLLHIKFCRNFFSPSLLRTAPGFQSPQLLLFDEVLRGILGSVCNISLSLNEQLWIQASLPVRLGGLGSRSAIHLAPSAFLASVAGSLELVDCIVPSCSKPLSSSSSEVALTQWSKWHAHPPLTEPVSF